MTLAAERNGNRRVVLHAENLWKSYDEETVAVLKGVDCEVLEGQTVALCGPSGCGKSTLLHLFGGLDWPDQGRISVNGVEVNRHRNLLRLLRHEVGFVFQLHNLIPDLTLAENCMIPTVAAGIDRRTANARLGELAERTGLSHRLGHRIQKLSGGERQRTAICRALMNRPKILLADEPTGSLDEESSNAVFELLLDLVATDGTTLLMATHDRNLARRCDRLVEMHDGKILEHSHAG
jgi:ABC-type lipoprotein export system ATPase subunit